MANNIPVTPGLGINIKTTDNGGVHTVHHNVDAVPADPFGANADSASATGSISAKLRAIAEALGGTITIDGTVDLGETDNAVLDAIAAALAGTLTVTANAGTNLNTSALATAAQVGEVQVSPTANTVLDRLKTIGSALSVLAAQVNSALRASPLPVSGTVTANLSATDNAVLDDILAKIIAAPATEAKQDTANGSLASLGGADDSAATAGAAGSVSAKLRTMTAQLATISAAAAANGLTSSRVTSGASTNATSLKASAGRIAQIDVFNTSGETVYLKFYNMLTTPEVGTSTPAWTIPVPPLTGYARSFPFGRFFSTGIAYGITAELADDDTTAVAAGDLVGLIDWI